MRLIALSFLVAASLSAQTYTNNYGSSGASLSVSTNFDALAWDTSGGYPSNKPWVVTANAGNINISGQSSLPQSYINANPSAAAAGGASFRADTTFSGLSGFKVSDLGSISYRVGFGELNTGPESLMLFLITVEGTRYQLYSYGPGSTNVSIAKTRSGAGNTGDHILTFTDFLADANNRTYVGLQFVSNVNYAPAAGGGFAPVPGQFADVNMVYASITLGAGGGGGGAPIPEPSTYGLMLGGLALAGAVIRRRKTTK